MRLMAACGVELDSGLAMLEELTEEIWWRGRSKLLCHACDGLLPGMRFSAANEPTPARRGSRRRVALSLVPDRETAAWASAYGLDLMLPPAHLVQKAGDKIRLRELATAAGVRIPASTVIRGLDEAVAARLWKGARLVVQRPENDLTGGGTRFVETPAALAALGVEWRGADVKVTEHCEGLPLTVSGCVLPGSTLVSEISHQLVGFERVTALPAAHCGNQLLDDNELPSAVVSECRTACARLGDELRNIGFLGMFGLDVLAEGSAVQVIEVNPRIQGVSSLVNAAEQAAGLLPLPGAHVLAFLGADAGGPRTMTLRARRLSQVFVYARHQGTISTTLPSGIFELVGGELRHVDAAPRLDDVAGRYDAALAWPFVEAGDAVRPGARVIVLQFGERVAPVDDRRELLDWVEPWVTAFEDNLGLSAGR
jgi:hypothetical protein